MFTQEKVKIKSNKIPLENNLINKYSTVKAIFANEKNILKNKKITIKLVNIEDLNNINLESIKIEEFKKIANNIFNKYHKTNIFINNDNKIIVTKNGINESAQKIYNARNQRNFMKEHLIVFANLEQIVKQAKLVSQTLEKKGRFETLYWNYYIEKISINNKNYVLEFEVRSLNNNQNQYRIQRIELKK